MLSVHILVADSKVKLKIRQNVNKRLFDLASLILVSKLISLQANNTRTYSNCGLQFRQAFFSLHVNICIISSDFMNGKRVNYYTSAATVTDKETLRRSD